MVTVRFPNQNCSVEVPEGTSILAAEIAARLQPDAPCGGNGSCGKCRVRILREDGSCETVLACQTGVFRDLSVFPLRDEKHRILTEGTAGVFELSPMVRALSLQVDQADLSDPSSEWTRLSRAVLSNGGPMLRPDPILADGLQKKLQALSYAPKAVLYRDELLDLKDQGRILSAAVDIGTTTIVLYLADAETGAVLGTESCLNPQTAFGADVISRANYAMTHSVTELRDAVRTAVGNLIRSALSALGLSERDLYAVTVVGNTCMHHLFLGIDPESLVLSPYVPQITDPLVLDAAGFGLPGNPRAKLFLLPCIAGFVGADSVSVMLSCGFDRPGPLRLAVDIGTNGELMLTDGQRIAACSTAAGPAFEGAKITFGMRGSDGAIDHFSLENGELHCSVLGGKKPRGICGSGLLDLTALLLKAGVLDETGRFSDPEDLPDEFSALKPRLRTIDGQRAFVIAEAPECADGACIYLSQKDVREIQLAKAAMAAGISLMLQHFGRKASDIEKVLLAGAFGNYMSPESACAIGLIPAELLSKTEPVGNAAGSGALSCALSGEAFRRASEIASRTEFIELAANPDFQDCFVDELEFPALQ